MFSSRNLKIGGAAYIRGLSSSGNFATVHLEFCVIQVILSIKLSFND